MINRRSILAAAACLAAGMTTATAQTTWNFPAAYPANNPHSENLVAFAKDVETATNGKLKITVHANASLFKAPEIKRAVATGQAQMGELLLSIHENEDPVFGARRGAVSRHELPGSNEALPGLEACDREEARRARPDAAVCCAVGAAGRLHQEGPEHDR